MPKTMTRMDKIIVLGIVAPVIILGVLALIGSFFRLPYGEWYGRIDGREGRVVGYSIFDLWITLNVDATDEEKAVQFQMYMADESWKGHEKDAKEQADHMRSWIGDWRWRVELWRKDRF